jgi:hypothetical protein
MIKVAKLNGQELRRLHAFGFTGLSGFRITYLVRAGIEEEELTYIGQQAAGQKWCSFEIEADEYRFSAPQCRLLRYNVEPSPYSEDTTRELVSVDFAIHIKQEITV